MLFCGFFAVKNTQNSKGLETAEALTPTNVNNATKIGNGDSVWNTDDDLWNSSKNRFNGTVFADLKSKLFGTDSSGNPVNPVDYIKDNADATERTISTSYYIVKASKINSKISGSNSNYGYVIKLDGKDWMVTSMTLSKQNQPVVTLMLANPTIKSKFLADNRTTDTTVLGRNMYSSSTLRNHLLTNSNWSKFTATGALKNYLVQPTNIQYQHIETLNGRYDGTPVTGTPWKFTMPNDALDTISDGWNEDYYSTAAKRYTTNSTYDGTKYSAGGLNASYSAWGNDYIWIPSGTEVGTAKDLQEVDVPVNFLWGMSNEQIKWGDGTSGNSSSDVAWYRTGHHGSLVNVHISAQCGTRSNNEVNSNNYVRPAIHLNIAAIENSMLVNEPQNASIPYDGNSHDLKGQSWYKTNIFDDTSCCTVAYTNDKGANDTPTAAGTYTATFTLGADYFWASGVKANKTRTATLIITPKELDVNFVVDSNTGLPTLSISNTSQICTSGGVKDTVNPVIHYYTGATPSDANDAGTDITKLKGNTQYYAFAEFDNKNYAPKTTNGLSFINPATAVNIEWDSDSSQDYSGGLCAFYLKDYDKKIVKVTCEEEEVEFDGYNEFFATNAGTYTVNLELLDKVNYCWGSEMGDAAGKTANTTIEFVVNPYVRKIQVADKLDWTVSLGGTLDATFDLDPLLTGAGTVKVMIWAKRTQESNPIELCTVDFTESTESVECQLKTAGIRVKGTYIIGAQVYDQTSLNARNYSIVFDDDYKLTIEEAVQAGGILWRLYSGKSIVGSVTDSSGETSTTWSKSEIAYNGKAYSFAVNPSGLRTTVDTSFGTDGYKTVIKDTTDEVSSVTDAGTYVTTVKLMNGAEYSIEWTIQKAKFDLSKVRWLEDGKISYVAGGVDVALVASTIPAGLTPHYGQQTSAVNAGDNGTAVVTFEVSDTDNYEIPVQGNKNSYIFTPSGGLSDFEWEKEWTVSAMQIPVNWTIGTIETEEGKKINVEVLAGAFGEYLTYLYYETDSKGVKKDPSAEGLKEPEVTENVIRYYVAEVQIKSDYGTNCEFASDKNLTSPVFEVGRVLTAVTVEPKKTEYTYWGSPVAFLYNVQGAISSSAFDVTYFKGLKKLEGAPSDPGEYRAQLSLKSTYTTRYYIDGASSFVFTVVAAKIEVSWNESVKPPVLSLTQDQAKYVSYEYRDGAGNTISFNTLKTTPGVYEVRVTITDTERYIFIAGDLTADDSKTEWYEFEIQEGESVTDPSTSTSFKPSTDPNGDGGGQGSGKTEVQVWLKNNKLQAGEEVQIGNIYGWDNNAFEITYIKDGQVVSDCSEAGSYSVEIGLKFPYSNMFELTGDTSFSFTVAAGEGGGDEPAPPPGDDGTGDKPENASIMAYLPIILSGVSLLLIIVFTVMTFNYNAAAKEAKAKTKKLAAMTYSVSPAGLLAMVLGLSENNWWIIAGVLMGLALIAAIAAFMSKGKKKRALEALEEEQERVAEEKEMARIEREEMAREQERREMRQEQERRENEMRMMFASMQQSMQQPQMMYGDMQNMIASTISALLPGLQQQMALPPASSDASVYGANPEADALRAQLAAQQEQMAQQQAQMAQQQELLNQILQNQQSQQYYDEEPEDDISWLGESDEIVSLEESYGNMDDEGKRYYYEIGSYIMNKPSISQNDGRYAVLFKYRGRTIFKLCIRDDMPVLYYPAGGGRGEVSVSDVSSLELAKSMIDRTVMSFDGQM